MRIGSLFAGIGGFDLAARWMDWETAWFSEVDPYASAVLAKHWPGVPNHGDITKIDFGAVEPVDMLCGGFPCQDISNAGKRAGIGGERSGLWSEYARAIGELRPRYVVVENSAALLGRGVDRVLGDLSEIGYDAEWTVLSAADMGAPHLRERCWLVAYPECEPEWLRGRPGEMGAAAAVARQEVRQQRDGDAARDRRKALADADAGGCDWRPRFFRPGWWAESPHCGGSLAYANGSPLVARGEWWRVAQASRTEWWTVEPDVGRVAHGIPARLDRLASLGNAIVPHCALAIFHEIGSREKAMRMTA